MRSYRILLLVALLSQLPQGALAQQKAIEPSRQPTTTTPNADSARAAVLSALTVALSDSSAIVRALALESIARIQGPQDAAASSSMRLKRDISVGEILTAVSLSLAIFSLVLTQYKDRALRRRESAERVRNAAASTLAKLERWRDLALLKYSEVQPALVEAAEELVKTRDGGAARDGMWKQLLHIQADSAKRTAAENIETAYVGLYGYSLAAYDHFVRTLDSARRLDAGSWLRFVELTQNVLLGADENASSLHSAAISTELRTVCSRFERDLRTELDRVIHPTRRFLEHIIRDADDPARLKSVTRSAPAGRRRALCVGINAYATDPLAGCVADAEAWASALKALGFESVEVLKDEAATRSAILDALHRLVDSSSAGDVLVFHFSGHGVRLPDSSVPQSEDGMFEALCPYDYDKGRLVMSDDLRASIGRLPEGAYCTMFHDCCFSGTITRFVAQAPSTSSETLRPRYLRHTPELKEAFQAFVTNWARRGVSISESTPMKLVTFVACRVTEAAYENDQMGIFSAMATRLLPTINAQTTNAAFLQKLLQGASKEARSTPDLDAQLGLEQRGFLQPLPPID